MMTSSDDNNKSSDVMVFVYASLGYLPSWGHICGPIPGSADDAHLKARARLS